MSEIVLDVVSIEELIELHSSLLLQTYDVPLNFEVSHCKRGDPLRDLRDRNSIYVLLRCNYPVYVGKSIDASSRTKNHLKDKNFDEIYIFHTDTLDIEKEVLKYVEFLCYYALWSRGYCTIYNSQDVWNSLPLKSQKGPRIRGNSIAYAHYFVKSFLESIDSIRLGQPEEPGRVIEVSYRGKQSIVMIATYWRPTIKEDLHEEAINYWNLKLEERRAKSKTPEKVRCSFAGAGSFALRKSSIGSIMRNDYDQQFTYDLFKDMKLFEEKNNRTIWNKSHPFPKSNLMLHILQGKNSPNARQELVVKSSGNTLNSIEDDWKKERKLSE